MCEGNVTSWGVVSRKKGRFRKVENGGGVVKER
jgi:hypothetical protein